MKFLDTSLAVVDARDLHTYIGGLLSIQVSTPTQNIQVGWGESFSDMERPESHHSKAFLGKGWSNKAVR